MGKDLPAPPVSLDGAPFGVLCTDEHGCCTHTNAAWQDICWLTLAESLGDGRTRGLPPTTARSSRTNGWPMQKAAGPSTLCSAFFARMASDATRGRAPGPCRAEPSAPSKMSPKPKRALNSCAAPLSCWIAPARSPAWAPGTSTCARARCAGAHRPTASTNARSTGGPASKTAWTTAPPRPGATPPTSCTPAASGWAWSAKPWSAHPPRGCCTASRPSGGRPWRACGNGCMRRVASRGLPVSLAHRDGAVLHTLMSAVVERDADGRSVRRLAVCEDISETVRRQAELVRSEPGLDGVQAGAGAGRPRCRPRA